MLSAPVVWWVVCGENSWEGLKFAIRPLHTKTKHDQVPVYKINSNQVPIDLGRELQRGEGAPGRRPPWGLLHLLRDELCPSDLRSSIRTSQPSLAESLFLYELNSAEMDRSGLTNNK
jgi:hypothetical protein